MSIQVAEGMINVVVRGLYVVGYRLHTVSGGILYVVGDNIYVVGDRIYIFLGVLPVQLGGAFR